MLNDTAVCISGTAVFVLDAAKNATISPSAIYEWNGTAASPTSTTTISTTGEYKVLVTDGKGCKASDSAMVTVNPFPTVSLGKDTAVCFSGHEIWGGTIANIYASILWSTGDTDNSAIVLTTGNVWVKVTNAFNCSTTDTINVTEQCDAIQLCFPNVFTPNNDGHNDDFRPCGNQKEMIDAGNYNFYSDNITMLHFLIYDRWGIKMFENNNPDVPVWDGLFSGKIATAGTYYWIVKYADSSKKSYEQTGYVTLIKD